MQRSSILNNIFYVNYHGLFGKKTAVPIIKKFSVHRHVRESIMKNIENSKEEQIRQEIYFERIFRVNKNLLGAMTIIIASLVINWPLLYTNMFN
ncbi:hypothetical protein G293_04515 [Candidatus Liberibacter africanus PTSAPSY]|uniref:Uncharacterized protein n=1 Tax=Candidatus Liberibacter africanus PTSAPSY TaxID=1277257 RepID=A0A0G3I7M7_LIBAF|nr:hypothetical protein G293_04515 [Candidatus Liberibacter africanus PTSAPSY]